MVARHLCLLGTTGTLGSAGLEAVLEASGHGGEGSHAAGTGGLPALGLLGPVVCFVSWSASCSDPPSLLPGLLNGWVSIRVRVGVSVSRTLPGLSSGETARSAGVLLDVQRSATCLLTRRHGQPAVVSLPSNCSPSTGGSLLFQLPSRRSLGYMLLTTATAQSVRLVVTLSERAGSLRCLVLSVSRSSGRVEIVGPG